MDYNKGKTINDQLLPPVKPDESFAQTIQIDTSQHPDKDFNEPDSSSSSHGHQTDEDSAEENDAAKSTEVDLRPQIAMQQVAPQCSGLLLDQNTLAAKSKSWRNTTKKRFSERKKFGYVEAQKEQLPPEVLR